MNIPDWNARQYKEIETLRELGERIGYGRCIQILQTAWSHKAQNDPEFPRPKRLADREAGIICVWCGVDSRTGKRAPD